MKLLGRRLAPEGLGRRLAERAALLALAGVFAAGPVEAQLTRGAITGTVRDASGAVVPGAAVTVTNMDTNVVRSTVTNELGFYRVPGLDPGRYSVRAELSGFSTVEMPNVTVNAAMDVKLNVEMKVGNQSETVTVSAEGRGIELNKTNATVALTATARQAVELPLPAGRNINNLILLAPAAVSTTGQGTYAVNGQRSRNNNFMIDGADNNDISVTIATTQVVPESVAEYQVLTNAYSVEFGRNSGAQVNVITKSGTNNWRGEVWDYYTTNELYSMNNIEKSSGLKAPPRFNRHQFGADVGGPIIKDRMFLFALYQHDVQRPGVHPSTLAAIRIPTPAGYAALQNVPLGSGQTTASRAAVLQQLKFLESQYGTSGAFRSVSNTLVNGVPIETGSVNLPIIDPSTYKSPLLRLDFKAGSRDNVTLRYYWNGRIDDNAISNCNFGSLFCGAQDLKDTNLSLRETHQFNSNLLNEFTGSLVRRNLDFPENDPTSPTATITGLFTIGGASNFPQARISDAYQFSDTATWTTGRHVVKFGADVRYNKLDNFAAFDSKGTFTFNNLQDYMNNTATRFQQALQTSSFDATQWQPSFFAQDDFRINPDLTLNVGLRYGVDSVPLGFFGATDSQSLAALVPPPVSKDKNNWAPAVGFAWSPRSQNGLLGDGKTVIRGGFRINYDFLFYNLLVVDASNFPRVVTGQLNNVQNLYPNLAPVSGSPVFNPLAVWTNSAENTQTPSGRIYSLSMQRELSSFIVEVGYLGSRSYHGVNQQEANPAVLTPEQAALVRTTRNPNAIPGVQARRLNPQFGSRTRIPSDEGPNGVDAEARSTYNALIVSLNRRFSHGLQFNANYTFSHFNSNNDASLGEGGTGDTGSSQRPQSYFDIASEWSVSQFDRPHRFVVNYIWEVPGPKSGALKQVLGGWQIAGVTQGQSGRPFTIATGVDSSGDGNTGSDRPNIDPSGSFKWDDGHRTFTNTGYYTAPLGTNNLPLQNGLGNGNAPRNSERGAGFWNTDLSILKRFYLGDRQLHIRGDILNAFNQDNFGNPNGNMTSPSFGQNTNNWGRRSVVLSAKFVF